MNEVLNKPSGIKWIRICVLLQLVICFVVSCLMGVIFIFNLLKHNLNVLPTFYYFVLLLGIIFSSILYYIFVGINKKNPKARTVGIIYSIWGILVGIMNLSLIPYLFTNIICLILFMKKDVKNYFKESVVN